VNIVFCDADFCEEFFALVCEFVYSFVSVYDFSFYEVLSF